MLFLLGNIPTIAQEKKDSVIVLPLKMAPPKDAKKIGKIKVGNNATQTHCDYEVTIATAKAKARAMGGNLVKITKLVEPAFISKCYSIEADVYHADPLPVFDPIGRKAETYPLPPKPYYATLYIYRLADTTAFAAPYSLHHNDSVVCTVKSRSRDSIRVYNEGPLTLWARAKDEQVTVDVRYGSVYYIRCGLKQGEIRMHPYMEVVDYATGEKEYGRLAKGKKDMDASYLQQIH
jgi:hypothetical protein